MKTVTLKNITLNDKDSKDFDIKKLVAKAYPVISASASAPDLTLTIKNPKDSTENIDILGFNINGRIVTASFDNKSLTIEQAISPAAGTTLSQFNAQIANK
jgi:hypothetical protein